MEGPRPSTATAPSIWYEAVAVPKVKPRGNESPATCSGRTSVEVMARGTPWSGQGDRRRAAEAAGGKGGERPEVSVDAQLRLGVEDVQRTVGHPQVHGG